jgi:hypothetical protein
MRKQNRREASPLITSMLCISVAIDFRVERRQVAEIDAP